MCPDNLVRMANHELWILQGSEVSMSSSLEGDAEDLQESEEEDED